MKADDKISIVIPIYNVEQYLERCILSVVKQTYENIEVLLIIDGSPDKSGEIAWQWARKDQRIAVYEKNNGGLSDARNFGIERSTGKYIMFVDSDDWIEKDAVETLYRIIKKYNADFSMGNHAIRKDIIASASIISSEKVIDQTSFLKMFFKINSQKNVQYAWGKLYKRELFQEIRYPIGMVIEDAPTTFKISIRSRRIALTDRIVYNYFKNDNSITSSVFNASRFDLLKAWDIIYDTAVNEKCCENVVNYAMFCRKRADFGILCDIALCSNYKKCMVEYNQEITTIINEFKKNYFELVKSKIPVSRKIIMTGFYISYFKTSKVVNVISNAVGFGIPR